GWLDGKRPRFVAAQAAGCAPIVDALAWGLDEAQTWPEPVTFAARLRVPRPLGDFIMLRAPREYAGSRAAATGGAVAGRVGVAASLLPPLGSPNAGAYLFMALGLAFAAAWWLGARQYVYLAPAGVLIGFGLGLVVPALLDLPSEISGPVFLGTLALGLAAVFVLAPQRRLPLARAAVLG